MCSTFRSKPERPASIMSSLKSRIEVSRATSDRTVGDHLSSDAAATRKDVEKDAVEHLPQLLSRRSRVAPDPDLGGGDVREGRRRSTSARRDGAPCVSGDAQEDALLRAQARLGAREGVAPALELGPRPV